VLPLGASKEPVRIAVLVEMLRFGDSALLEDGQV
jgi:hypothetical protein